MTASYPTTAAPFTAPGAPGSPRSTAPTERNTIVELQTELAAVEADLIAGRGASASLTARLAVISAAIVTAQAAAATDASTKDAALLATLTVPSWYQPWLVNPPQVIAHRGGSLLQPEETFAAYDYSARLGFPIDGDVWITSDGYQVLNHDQTVDAMTTGTGDISAKTLAQFKALTVDTSAILGASGYSNTGLISLTEMISRYGNSGPIYSFEAKGVTGAQLVTALQATGISPGRVMVSSFTIGELAAATAAGFPTCWIVNALATGNAATAAAAGVNVIACSSATAPTIAECTARNILTYQWTMNGRVDLAAFRALGGTGVFSDDPEWVAGTSKVYLADPYSTKKWWPGYQYSAGLRATFQNTADLQLTRSDIGYSGMLQGWMSPIANRAATYTIDFKAAIDTVLNDTRWFSIYLATDDTPYFDGVTGPTGYHLLFRRSGILGIYRRDSAVSATLLNASAGLGNLTLTTKYDYRLTVTPTTITLLNVTTTETVTSTDSTYRGGYLWFGCNGAQARISNVAIT